MNCKILASILLLAGTLFCGMASGQETGSYPNATTPLYGTERLLGDQSTSYPCVGCTRNVTPLDIADYFETLTSPFSIAFNNNGVPGGLIPSAIGQYCLNWSSLTAAPALVTCSGGGSSATFQVNGINLSNQATINFENSSATNGLTLEFLNPSLGNVQLGLTGTLSVAGGGTGTATTSQGFVFIGPVSGAGAPAFRALVGTDIPTLNQNTTGTAANITATSNSTLITLSALSLPYTQLTGAPISLPASSVTIGTTSVSGGTNAYLLYDNAGAMGVTNAPSISGANLTALPSSASLYPTLNQSTTGTAANVTASSNSTLTTLSALSLPSTQITGLGTFATANAATPPAIGGTTPNTGAFTTLSLATALSAANGGTGSGTAPASGQILVGNAGGTAYAPQTVSGDCALTNAGVVTCTKTGGVAFSALATAIPGTGVVTALGVNVGSAGSLVTNGGALGTPSSGVATNLIGTASGLNIGGNAATATALAAIPTQCPGGEFSTGIAASGNANCTTPAGGGNVSTSGTPAANQVAVWASGTTVQGIAMGAGQVLVGAASGPPVSTSSPTLGASGTLGSLTMGNATSGTVTLEPVTGALGAVTASLPANTGTVAETNLAQTFSALQTFGTNISIGGVQPSGATGTGNAVFATSPTLTTPNIGAATGTSLALSTPLAAGSGGTGNSGAPANGDLLIGNGSGYSLATLTGGSGIAVANAAGSISISTNLPSTVTTWSAAQTFPSSDILIKGSSTGTEAIASANASASNFTWTIPAVTDTAVGTAAAQTLTNKSIAASEVNSGTLAAAQMPALTGDVTSSAGSTSVTVSKVNGASFPTSANCVSSNGSAQPVAGCSAPNRTVTTSPTVASTDMGGQIVMNVSGGGTLTIPAISSTVFANGMTLSVVNYSASTAAVSTTPTVNAGGGCVSGTGIPSGDSWQITSNGTSLDCIQTTPTASGSTGLSGMTAGQVPIAATATTITSSKALAGSGSGITTGPTSSTSGDVVTYTGTAGQTQDSGTLLSSVTKTIASGTATLGTSAISSGSCATVVTVSATGVATTDAITVGFNSDPTAVTGYGASATGAVLTIYPYPTANNANFKVCNSTGTSITPGALTLNWRVTR